MNKAYHEAQKIWEIQGEPTDSTKSLRELYFFLPLPVRKYISVQREQFQYSPKAQWSLCW